MKPALILIACLVTFSLASNGHLLRENSGAPWSTFHLPSFLGGDWWRPLTYVFAHFTWYHLLSGLIVTVVLLLLLPPRFGLLAFATGAIGGLLMAVACVDDPHRMHLGGLSSLTHGLPIALVWPWLRTGDRLERTGALLVIGILLTKGIIETTTAQGLITDWHLWDLGCEPCGAAHLGGTLAILALCIFRDLFRSTTYPIANRTPC